MGNDYSKKENTTDFEKKSASDVQDSPPLMKYDEWMLNVITEDLQNDTQMFVVNNILMSIQFFENYQKEVLSEDVSDLEDELNKTLLKELRISYIKPDYVLDYVNDKVRFTANIVTTDPQLTCAVAPRRLYVVNDMFDVVNTFEDEQYTTAHKLTYRIELDQSRLTTDKREKRFVRLKLMEHVHTSDCQFSSALKNANKSKPESNDNSKTKPDEDYSVIIKNNTPRQLSEEFSEPKDCLPMYCFKFLLDEKEATEICIQSEEVNGNISKIKLFDKNFYVDAKGYMRYFKNNIFLKSLGRTLGFSYKEVELEARSIPGKVLCRSNSKANDVFEHEVIPCVSAKLPVNFDFNFEDRNVDENTNLYKWPTDRMIKEIQRMPCVLVPPKGYWRKNSQHKYPNLEWEIAFPKIEKYLFTKMSHTQIRCYLFLLLIHRIHIEPKTKYQGLLVDHIRHHIFWECWKNFKDWPEHRLGYKLKEIIENLMSRISKNNLPDFFVKGKNLFDNVPIKFLYIASEELQNILERPAMRLIRILESLSFSPHFYKILDVRKLKRMLYLTGLELATTQLPVPMRNDDLDKLQKFNNPETRVEYIKLQKRRHAKAQKLQRTGQRRIEDDGESESKWPCKKYFNEDKIKISHILLFFADQFISLATYSSLRSTAKQTRFFLRQAWYLTKIKDGLGTAHSQKEFEHLQGIIEEMEEELYKKELARKSVGLSPEMRLGGSRKLHQEIDDAGEASICLDIDEEVEIRAKAGRRIYIPKKNLVLRQEVSGVVDDVSGVSYGQVEKSEKVGRKNNTGKSVSFLEPQIDDFLEADA